MIIVPLVRTADNHNRIISSGVQAKVIHGWLKEVGVLGEPFGEVDRWWKGHTGEVIIMRSKESKCGSKRRAVEEKR